MIKKLSDTEDKKRLLSNFCSLSVLQLFTYVLPLFILPYLVRVLGLEKFGLIVFSQSFIAFFNMFADYGFNLSATREISIHRDNKQKITEIFSSVIVAKSILVLISFIVLCVIVFSFGHFSEHWRLYFFTFLSVIGQAFFPVWYFQGLERMKYLTIVNIFSKLISAIAIFIFIQNENDYILVPILNGIGIIVGSAVSLYIIYKKFNQAIKFKNLKVKNQFRSGFYVFLSIFSSSLLSASPILIIGMFMDYVNAGYYSAFEKLIAAIKGFFYIINQTFFPKFSKVYTENMPQYKLLWKKISIWTVIISIATYIILFMVSDVFIKYYLGEKFIEYISIFYILSFSIVLYTLINSLGLNALLVMEKSKHLSYSQIIPAILFVCISPFVLKYYGLHGFLLTIILSDILIIVIRIYFLRGFLYGKSKV